MPRICLSYRRSDSAAIVGRIYDRLVERYGANSIFIDLSGIPYGADFRMHIESVFRETDLLLAAIGPKWLGESADGAARIADRGDPVRAEIYTALRWHVLVIPVLVDGAKMPTAEQLPRNIKDLAFRNAIVVDSGVDFHLHMERLLAAIDQALGLEARPSRKAELADHEPSLNAPKADVAASRNVPSVAKRTASRLMSYFVVPLTLLLVAHYLIVIKWDLDSAYLRPVAIIVPLASGFLSLKGLRFGIAAAILLGLSLAVAAVVGMMTVVGLIDRHAILPQSEAGWQEALEFAATITLATVAGNLLGRIAAPAKLRRWRPF